MPEVPWRCICGAGDDAAWHSEMCAASNTPDAEWYGCSAELHRDWGGHLVDVGCERSRGHEGPHSASLGKWEW